MWISQEQSDVKRVYIARPGLHNVWIKAAGSPRIRRDHGAAVVVDAIDVEKPFLILILIK